MKRVLDVVLVLVFAPLWIPFACFAAVIALVGQGFPLFFVQERAGLGGRGFFMLKFRTMRPGEASDAERLTRVGRFLRVSSLDELPEFLNVLRGDMSLVGPRPLPVRYLPRYTREQARRHEVRPGITGWAQVNGRNALDWETKFRYDVEYVDRHTLAMDFRILFMTVGQVLFPRHVSHDGEATMGEFFGIMNDMKIKTSIVALLGLAVAGVGFASDSTDCATYDVSVSKFLRLAGETDDSGRLQRAIEAASPHGVVYLPKGVYEIGSSLWVTNSASVLMHKSAILRAVKPMDYVLIVDLARQWGMRPGTRADGKLLAKGEEDYNFFVRGGQIDGNALASCMALDNFHHFTLANVTFLNGLRYGLRVDGRGGHGYELVASDCYFKTVIHGCKGNEAVYASGGDSHYVDCIVVDYTIGFHLGRRSWANKLTRCHVWGGPIREMLDDSVNYLIEEGGNVLTDCYADTGKTGFWLKAGGTRLFGCSYFSNPVFKLKDVVMVRSDRGETLISGCTFSKTDPSAKLLDRRGGDIFWRDCTYSGFAADESLPGNAFGGKKVAGTPSN